MDTSNTSSNSTNMGGSMSGQLEKDKSIDDKDTSDYCSKLFMMTFQKQLIVEDLCLEKEHLEFISNELLKVVKHKPEWEQLSTVVNNLCSAIIEEVKNTIENDEQDKLGLKKYLKKSKEAKGVSNGEQLPSNDESMEDSENKSRENGKGKESQTSNGKNEERKENGESVVKKKRVEEDQS